MLHYLVILLDKTSVSYCYGDNPHTKPQLISIEDLKSGIFFAMKENLMIQFVYPSVALPQEYLDVIDTIDHHDIKLYKLAQDADVQIFENIDALKNCVWQKDTSYVLRIDKNTLFANVETLNEALAKTSRLNIVIKDTNSFTENDFEEYKNILTTLSNTCKDLYLAGATPQLNILTDRMMLKQMNNCNAGVENITLAPNGKFYICPAFYYKNEDDSVGNLKTGIDIKNKQLYALSYAPLCRKCDAFQCHRCVWMNRKTTLEINTPSHEQCVVSHLERNASRQLLGSIREKAQFLPEIEIDEIKYLDPFDVRKKL